MYYADNDIILDLLFGFLEPSGIGLK